MLFEYNDENADGVALLAEGVDRNFRQIHGYSLCLVALLAEGVDRNPAVG